MRVVVAEGPSTRKGLLRFVLEGEGYQVVADAATSAELARTVAQHRPDVVVMDDRIGAMAVGMIRETAPSTRVILVWPGAVVPIGGDARVEPSEVLRELGRTMERVTGQQRAPGVIETLSGSDTTERARTDAATLREILARGGAAQLQRAHLRAGGHDDASEGTATENREPAEVVVLPVTATIGGPVGDGTSEDVVVVPDVADAEDVVVVPEAAAPAFAVATDGASSRPKVGARPSGGDDIATGRVDAVPAPTGGSGLDGEGGHEPGRPDDPSGRTAILRHIHKR